MTFKTVSPRLSEKSRREQKSPYPTTGATTNFQSSEVVIILLRQSPPAAHLDNPDKFDCPRFGRWVESEKLQVRPLLPGLRVKNFRFDRFFQGR